MSAKYSNISNLQLLRLPSFSITVMFPRAERPSEKKKDRFRPKETYEWYREEAILLKAKQSAFQTSLEECCVLLADIAEEVYNYDAIKDSSSGILYMKKLLHRLATWKRNIENPYTHKRAARLYTDEPEVDTTDRRREAETNKEVCITNNVVCNTQ